MQRVIDNIRASVFTKSIDYSWELLEKLKDILPGWLPSGSSLLQPAGADGPVPEWCMLSPDHKDILVCWSNKMDLITKSMGQSVAEGTAKTCELAKKVFSTLMEMNGGAVNRFAIAPKFACLDTLESINKWMTSTFVKSNFGGVSISEMSFTQAFALPKEIDQQQVMMNFLARFQMEQRDVQQDGRPAVAMFYFGDFDINSVPAERNPYTIDTMLKFFDVAPSYCKEFEEYFFGA